MATYSANISVKVVGLSDLTKLESRVEKLQSRFTELNDAAAKVAAPFKGHIEALEKLNTLLLSNERLLKNQAQAIDRMERAGRNTSRASTKGPDPAVHKEITDQLQKQVNLLREKASALKFGGEAHQKMLRAAAELKTSYGGNLALVRQLIRGAKSLLDGEESLAKQKSDGTDRAIRDSNTETDTRVKNLRRVERETLAMERRVSIEMGRILRNTARDEERAAREAASRRRTAFSVANRTAGVVDRSFGGAFSGAGRAVEGGVVRAGATAGLIGAGGAMNGLGGWYQNLEVFGKHLPPVEITGAAGAVTDLVTALGSLPGGLGAAAVAAAAFAPWLPKIAQGAKEAGEAVGQMKVAQPLKRALQQGGASLMESGVDALSGNLDLKLDTAGYQQAETAGTAFANRFNLALMAKLGQGITEKLQARLEQQAKASEQSLQKAMNWADVLAEAEAIQARITRQTEAETRARQEATAAIRANEAAMSEKARQSLAAAAEARRNPTQEVVRRPLGGAAAYPPGGAWPAGSPTAVEGSVVNFVKSRAELDKKMIDNVHSYRRRLSVIENNAEIDKITQQLNAELDAIDTAFSARVKADNKWWALQENRLREKPDVNGPAARKRRQQEAADAQKARATRMESIALGVGFPMMFGAGPASIAGSFAGSFVGQGFGGQILGGAIGTMFDQFATAAIGTAKALRDPIESFNELKAAGIFASRAQENLIQRLIELGRISEANAIIQGQVVRSVGNSGVQDLQNLDESAVRLSQAWAELNLQMQALIAGPLAWLLDNLGQYVGKQVNVGRLESLRRDLSPDDRAKLDARIEQAIKAEGQRTFVRAQDGIPLNAPNANQLKNETVERILGEFASKRPPEPEKPLSDESRLKEAEAALARAERAEALRRQGVQLERQQSDLRLQIEEQVHGLRRRAADIEQANADLRRSVEEEIFRKRQELARIESDNAREQARLAIERTDLQLSALRNLSNDPGADMANTLLDAVREYVKIRGNAEEDFRQKERNFKITMADMDRAGEKYRFEVARKVAELRRQAEEFSRDVTRARVGAERAMSDLQIQAADYALEKAKERIALEVDAQQRITATWGAVTMSANNPFLRLINEREAINGSYGSFNRGGRDNGHTAIGSGVDNNLVNMTIAEIQHRQFGDIPRSQHLHAVGKYQIIGETLKGLMNGAYGPTGVSRSDKFTPEVQDKLAMALAMARVVPGSADRTMAGLRQEWIGFQNAPDAEVRAAAQYLMDLKAGGGNAAPQRPERTWQNHSFGGRAAQVGDTITPQMSYLGAAPPAPVLPPPGAPVPSAPRPQVDTATALAGLNVPTPVVTGVADLNSSLDDLNTKMGNAQRQALALAESFKNLSIEQANQKLEQTFTSEINKLNQPMDDLLKAQQDRLAYEREYADLIIDKVSPELAEQVIKIKQQTQAQVDKIAASEKMLDELETELTNRKLLTEELQTQLDLWRKLLGAQVDVLKDKGQTAITTAEASESPEGRLTKEVLTLRTELNKLQDPVNQIVAGATAIGDAFHDSFRQAITGSISAREAFANFFQSVGQHFVDMASKMIASYMQMELIGLVAKFLPPSVPSLGFGGGTTALAPTGITSALPSIPSGGGITGFSGGGYTGNGARAGGIDGHGGFPAILHPQETVVDHWSANRDLFNGMGTLAGESPYDENQQALDSQGRAFSDNQQALDNQGRDRDRSIDNAAQAFIENQRSIEVRERAFNENQKLISETTRFNRERTLERERSMAMAGGYEPIEVSVTALDPASTGLVTVDQLAQSSQMAVKQAQTQLLAKLKNNPAVRAGAGL